MGRELFVPNLSIIKVSISTLWTCFRPVLISWLPSNLSAVSSRGRFSGRMSGFRNEGSRGRSNFGGVRGYGRGDFSSKGDFGGRGGSRGGSSHGDGGGYQRVDHVGSGGGRGGRSASVAGGSQKNVAPRMPDPA